MSPPPPPPSSSSISSSSSGYFIQLIFVHFHLILNLFSGSTTTIYNWNDKWMNEKESGVREWENMWYSNNNNNNHYLFVRWICFNHFHLDVFIFPFRSLALALTLLHGIELSFQYLRKLLRIWPMHSSHSLLYTRRTGDMWIEVKRHQCHTQSSKSRMLNRRRRSNKHDCCNRSGLHSIEVWHRHYTTYMHV